MSGSFPQLAIQTPDLLGGLARVEGIRSNRLQMLAAQQQLEDGQAFRQAAPDLLPALSTAEGPQRQNILAKIAGLGERGAGIALPMIQQDRERAQFQDIMRQAFGGGQGAPTAPAQAQPAAPRSALDSVVADLKGNGMPLEGSPPRAPRGIRNNNPLNIQAGPFTQGLPGFAGSDGRFARFQAPEQGIAAADQLLTSYGQRGINTPMALVSRWAPAGDGGNNPPAYATAVARALGVGVNDQIDLNDPGTRQRVIAAMAQVETGQPLAQPQQPQQPQQPPAGVAPQSARTSLPTVEQLVQLAMSGNPQAMAFVQRMAPLVQQANPSFSFQNIGGTLYAINPQNPSQRVSLGQAGDPPNATLTEIGGRRVVVNPQNPSAPPVDIGPVSDPTTREREDRNRSFSDTRSLREEYNSSQPVKDFATIRPSFEAIQRAQRVDTRAADIDMVFAFAKMLDPASVVREGEQITLMRTGGVFDTIAGYVSGLAGGGRLTPDVRTSLLQQAQSRYQVAADSHDERLDYYRGLAEQNNLNPAQVGRYARERSPAQANTEGDMPRAPGQQPGGAGGGAPRAQLNGRTITVRGGAWVYEDTGAPAQ